MVLFFLTKPEKFSEISGFKFHLMVFCTLLIAAGGYIINDYFDIKIDRINKPDRVWIGKEISRRWALIFHQSLSVLGVLTVFFVIKWAVLINFSTATLLWFYASGLKKRPFIGNFIVSFLTGLTIALVALLFDFHNKAIYMYAVFAFFINFVREIVKDMEDVKGDQTHGAKTLPIIYGIHKVKWLLYGLLFILILTLALFVFLIESPKMAIFFGVFSGICIILINQIHKADRKEHFTVISNLLKFAMILGIISMILFK